MGGLIRHYTDHLGSYSPVGQPERVVGGLVSLTGQRVVAWQVQRPGNGEWDCDYFYLAHQGKTFWTGGLSEAH